MASGDTKLKEGLTLPAWMKTKPTKEFEPFAGSPPAPEDSFFYIRYPKKDMLFGNTNIAGEVQNGLSQAQSSELSSAIYNAKEKDWSKHTKPCQDVLHGIAPINTAGKTQKPKSAGTDDGFKGEGAACGSSVVKVATQMISTSRGFAVAEPEPDADAAEAARYHGARRGSRSLPASPTSRRKHPNRYFTSPFEPVEDANSRSWLTMALLGFKKDLATSTSTLTEEDTIQSRLQGGSLAESVESLGPAPAARPPPPLTSTKSASSFRPKPSELREMNFWSPTSM